ncbi:uncharacterized protein BT62DRAFT_932960 [Guyanagaster necrorhizus]|uniref:Uncharacterized protein n=1 Tax=Guyanagaster necrorhizus TaxID=856835 RepID=A0A9P7VTT6_9AGAR|nr:uncharacterized protein BT62DRAFT_932960 [Guyanagaster necrorhizus MCA 3950]KAG7445796.1 hypothetical protein BT62DRAFT_932960 [Guyanagaster necrorhizus MCA 3950]
MAPLAGRPPYATDEPDSFYETPQPQRRIRQPQPENPNNRSSAYNVYDNYLDKKRQSGTGALGMGFLNGSMEDDDDDDDDYCGPSSAAESRQAGPLPSKHAALAAATASNGNRRGSPSPPPQYIASPRPGYAAPIAALNNLPRPEPAAAPARQHQPQISVNAKPPRSQYPFVLPINTASSSPVSISSSVPSTPHPLQPPMTPITPVFARPTKGVDVKFRDEKPIIRGNSEGMTLPKRGERGDEFWRRFSVIAKEENRKSSSSWLKKTQNGTTRLSRLVWVIGTILAICAAAGIGIGFWISHNSTSSSQPTAIGGSADNASTEINTDTSTSDTSSVSTSLHVSATNTVARRFVEPRYTSSPLQQGHLRRVKHLH